MAAATDTPNAALPVATDNPASVHHIYSQSTQTWQYVVADPVSKHCIVLDPVRDRCADAATMSTTAADAIISLVNEKEYVVDYILETHASGSQTLSAAWYLRMQFSQSQGWPPQLCNEATVSSLQTMWQRKYGAGSKFSTTIRSGLADGEVLSVGQLSCTCMHLPGFGSPHRRAYLVGLDLFGAHSIALPVNEAAVYLDKSSSVSAASTEAGSELQTGGLASTQRILSLPGDTRVWREGGDTSLVPETAPYDLVSRCAVINKQGGAREPSFVAPRQEDTVSLRAPSHRSARLKARLRNGLAV